MFNQNVLIMVLFHSVSRGTPLSSVLNAILTELYLLEGIYSSSCYSAQCRELVIAIRHLIRFGKLLGCKVFDTKVEL